MSNVSARLDRYIYWAVASYCLLFAVSVPLANSAIDMGLLLLVVRFIVAPRTIQLDRQWLVLAGIFLVICLVSAWHGYNPGVSIKKTWQVAYAMVAPFILASFIVKTPEQRKTLLVFVAVSVAIASVYEIYQGLLGRGSEGGFLGRMQLAAQIVQVFPLLVFGAVTVAWQRNHMRTGFLFLSFFITGALLFTVVRGAWLALAVVVLITVLTITAKSKFKASFLIGLVLLGMAILGGQPRLQNSLASGVTLQAQSVSERFLMWRSAGNMFLDYPLLGIGIGNFGDLYEQKYILPAAKEGRHPHPHNIYMQTLSEVGILGFVSFAAVWAYAFVVLIRNRQRPGADFWQQAVPIAVIGFLIYGLTDNVIYHFPAGFQFCWFLIGSCWRNF